MIDAKQVMCRFEGLKSLRTGWEPLWKEIRDFILPDMGVFEGEQPEEGGKRWRRLVQSEATQAADVLAAGLLSGVSSPSRPWLRLTTFDPELDERPEVKQWLADVQRMMLMVFAKADVYNQLHQSYLELPVFGQACTIARPHFERVVNLQNLTVGQYWLSEDEYGRVDTLYRRVRLTAKQMVQTWGLEAVSPDVRSAYEKTPFQCFDVIHAIEPRWERDDSKRDGMNKPFASVYIEEATLKKLSEGGYDDFPAMCPRWMTIGNSVYGRGPGAKALGAAKSLQQLNLREANVIDYLSDPPMLYPVGYTGRLKDFLPGGRIPVAGNDQAVLRPAIDMQGVKLDGVELLVQRRVQEIHSLFYTNIFNMIQAGQENDRTATEIQALEQEKVMMLGPVLERIHSELLDPLVTNTFNFMVEMNKIPEIPDDLQGETLNVEYISVLAENQKNSLANGIIKLTQEIGMLAQLKPEAIDKIDVDKAVDELADVNGVPPSMIVNGDKVALVRKQRAQQLAQQQQLANMESMTSSLKNMAPAADSPGMQDALADMSGEAVMSPAQ